MNGGQLSPRPQLSHQDRINSRYGQCCLTWDLKSKNTPERTTFPSKKLSFPAINLLVVTQRLSIFVNGFRQLLTPTRT